MPERRGGIYARMDSRAHTRKSDRKPRKSYAKGIPGSKIHMFDIGNSKGSFDVELSLTPEAAVQIKHNALEAARIAANKILSTLGPNSYHLKMRVYPHHILRENPLATGAGADRFQEGMRRAYGKPIGTAARLKRDQKIMSVRVKKEKEAVAKDALRRAKMKFPVRCRTIIEDLRAEEAPKEKPKAKAPAEKPAEKIKAEAPAKEVPSEPQKEEAEE
jgi:large subunit ribosomal protein L10e